MKQRDSEIAIIGMSCVFPGADTVADYWSNILEKRDCISDAPDDWGTEYAWAPETRLNHRTYCKRGGFLGPLAQFEPAQYGVMPNAVDGTEPDHFLALRAAWEALRDAGYHTKNAHRERTEVIIGRGTYVNRGNTTAIQHSLVVDSVLRVLQQLHPEHTDEELDKVREALRSTLPPFHADTAAGLVPNIISGRIANRLDLMGSNYIIDAACASSLIAIDAAVRDLRLKRCDMVVAGGVNASVPPVIMIIFSQLQALSRQGVIRPFGSEADGTLLSEGVGMVVLKRLEDAERDGDRIYGLIKGVGSASDGKAIGLLAPRLEGEELALRRAYEDAAVDPVTIGLVEAHGTATLVGDAVELQALKNVFGNGSKSPECALGSVKSMIGHTMPASGMAGLIKATLALHHKVLPPTMGCDPPNPKLGIEGSRFYLNTETRPWIHGAETPRRAGVNAFGFGGINAHAVLEEYTGPHQAEPIQHEWHSEMFIISAASAGELPDAIGRVLADLATAGESVRLRDVAWTLNCLAEPQAARICFVAASLDELKLKLERAAAKLRDPKTRRIRDIEGIYFFQEPLARTGKVAFLFPGEGAQYRGMMADLCHHFPEAREWFDRMDRAFLEHPRGYVLSRSLFSSPGANPEEDRLWSMDLGAEAAFCGNQAMLAVLSACGVKPDVMVGHSTGEHSALLGSGIVEIENESEMLRYIRGVNEVFEDLGAESGIRDGVLLAVAGTSHDKLQEIVNGSDDLFIALDNCPHQVVLFGSRERTNAVQEALSGTAAICQELMFGRAYHTPWFEPFARRLQTHFHKFRIQGAKVPVYSCVNAALLPDDAAQITDLICRQWSQTVRFRETVAAMHADGVRVFVEVGARGNLTAFLGDILRGKQYTGIATNVQHRPAVTQLQHALSELVAHGVPVNLSRLYQDREVRDFRVAPPAKRRPAKLAMGLQPVTLPADFRLPRKAEEAVIPFVPQPVAIAAAVNGHAPVPVPAPAPVLTPRDAVMQGHLETMRMFLQTQQKVVGAVLASRANHGAVPAAPAPDPLPFMTEVLEVTPGVRAVARHTFTLTREPMFLDHTFGRGISNEDPALNGLPVVPLTVTMEALAEAAALMFPGKVVTGMRDLRASRWITMENGSAPVELTAEAVPGEPLAAKVRLRPAGGDGIRPVWAEVIVEFADTYPAAPAPTPQVLADERPSNWTADRLYTEGMFHGPAFRAVQSVDRTGSNGAVAMLVVPPRENLIAGHPAPRFVLDPVILDATGQAVAFWSQERIHARGDIFPYRLARLSCYAAPAAAGTTYQCRVFATHVGERDMSSDIEVIDSTGRLLYRMTGWEDARLFVPEALWDLRIAPRTTLLAQPWPEPVRHLAGQPLVCSRIAFPEGLLDGSHGIWAKVIAGIVLSAREREEFQRLSGVSNRQQEWLLGRCAAKDAIRRLLRERAGIDVQYADIEIGNDEKGRPVPTGQWLRSCPEPPSVSISQSAGMAVAIASLGAAGLVGVDIRHLANAGEKGEPEVFTDREREQLLQVPYEQRQEWSARIWCAKESLAKAFGEGLRHGLKSVSVVKLHAGTGIVEAELADGAPAHLRSSSIPVRTLREGDLVCSAAVIPLWVTS